MSGVVAAGVLPEIGVKCRGEGNPSWAVLNSRPCSVTRDNRLRLSSDQLMLEMGTAGDDESMMFRRPTVERVTDCGAGETRC